MGLAFGDFKSIFSKQANQSTILKGFKYLINPVQDANATDKAFDMVGLVDWEKKGMSFVSGK
jgi:hypothetical protein